MRSFLVLSFIAVASAGRLGYNYQPGVSVGSGISPILSLGGIGGDSGAYGNGINYGSGIIYGSGGGSLGSGIGGLGGGISYGSGSGSIGSGIGGLGGGISYGSGSGSIGSGIGGLGGGISYGSESGSLGSGIGGLGGGISSIGSGIGGLGSGISYGSGSSSIGGGALSLGGGLNFGGIGQGGGISYGSGGQGAGVSYGGGHQVIDGGLSKEFYIYSAPEEPIHQGQNSQSSVTTIKKNLRVIFIKAPENNAIHRAALQIAKQATEDKTAIYVLSKEPDVSEIASQVQQISENVRQKPEVRFIKYRTPQDALHAQHSIQQQYEQLGGTSQSSNEGVAPVLNFASPAQHSGHSIVGGAHVPSGGSLGLGGSLSSGLGSGLSIASGSDQSSQVVDLGSSGSSSNAAGNKKDYLPPVVV